MAHRITIPQPNNNYIIGSSFNDLFKVIADMESAEDDDIIWDFSNVRLLNPFFLLPLWLYKQSCGKNITYCNMSSSLDSYLRVIHFENGFDTEKCDDLESSLNSYKYKRYIPITIFPSGLDKVDFKSKVESIVGKILKNQLKLKGDLFEAVTYLISEACDNITEHSHSDFGYIFAQYYKDKEYIDICIADRGITVLGSYTNLGMEEIKTDVDALKNACVGVSTKNLAEAENRGYGIITSKEMLTVGLNGGYFLFSGGAFYRKTQNGESYVSLPENIRWDGTIVLLRIPYSQNLEFKYLNYLEV